MLQLGEIGGQCKQAGEVLLLSQFYSPFPSLSQSCRLPFAAVVHIRPGLV